MNAPLAGKGDDSVPTEMTDAEAIREWCQRLNVSEAWLREAAAKFGAMPAAVHLYSRIRSKLSYGISAEVLQQQSIVKASETRLQERRDAAKDLARRVLLNMVNQ